MGNYCANTIAPVMTDDGNISQPHKGIGKVYINTFRTGSFKLFKRPFPGFLTFLTL